ncbi:DUF3298 domain-containing protein [Brevibacillus sp. SYP-B805]|uniref:WG repeat-containing protein n=1 Tax=Brevibacillus sp. SYP-B805 TaxID=1578199 RepID=UPI0013ED7E46|nr:WG repeat-containing protein [Brevibacillus sp. SYP-B805]NGQ96618.1 DUF3298 domain-containing protein [Brevibacillus sp. SYP-B805]
MWKEQDVIYWYHVANAQVKAGMLTKAKESIAVAKGIIHELRTTLQPAAPLLYPASLSTVHGVKWGYIDDKGRFAISPRFEYAEEFQPNGLAVVQLNGRNGLINRSGSFVVQPVYSTITRFSEGRAAVLKENEGFQVIDESGNILTPQPYAYIGRYQEGKALFSQTDAEGRSLYGYLDRRGQEAIPAQFASGGDFADGRAVVQIKEGEFALIGRGGERLQTYPYAFVGPLGDGLLAFQEKSDGPHGYLDEKGTVVIPPQYTSALPFEQGRAVVNVSTDPLHNQYGLIDKKGNFLIKPAYNDIQLLGEGRVAVGKAKRPDQPYVGSIYAIATTNGRFLSDFLYRDVTNYRNGYASANNGSRTFFLDRSGKIAKNLPMVGGAGTLSVAGGLIRAAVDLRVSYYDRKGRLVWRQNTVIPLSGPYRVRERKFAPNNDYILYYPQIEGMADRAAQERVNQRLKELAQVKPIAPDQQLDSSYSGDFSVAFFRDHLVVLELTGYQYPFGAAHGMPSMIYAHVDLQTGRIYRLKDLFKPNSNYVQVLSDIVGEQIRNDSKYSYVFPDSYHGIQPDQPFYVTADALHLYFAPYEIAPFAAGFPTFRIPYREIMPIIDTSGPFWQSFHA